MNPQSQLVRSTFRLPNLALAATLLFGVCAIGSCASDPKSSKSADRESDSPASASVFNPRINTADDWQYETTPGRVFRTNFYTIYTTSSNRAISDRLPVFMEHALAHYTSTLGTLPKPPSSMETFIFDNRPQWARMTQRVMGDDAGPYLQIQRGGFASRGTAVLFDIGVRDTFAIAAHEGWHQYTQQTFRVPLPIWLEEGVATYMEGFRWDALRGRSSAANDAIQGPLAPPRFTPWYNWERFVTLVRAARANRLMPLTELVSTSPQDLVDIGGDRALLYYAQVWALTLYLAEGEKGTMRGDLQTLLQDAANGAMATKVSSVVGDRAARSSLLRRRGDAVLRTYFAKDAAAMNEGYMAFVAVIAKPGARQWIAQGQSPVENAPPLRILD